ncbi:Asp23/Gls24 family envelope stress response protein [Clostridium sediminicola]|uniref:Asp23/Gls24 family envelope stress response protein n=1 Tax=Clostridium sediminicola TaxID=3114879 RepID=UPI0031F27308
MEDNIKNLNDIGIVKISDEVVEVIAGLAASEIDGIVGMSTKLVGGITKILTSKKSVTKGVKVSVGEDSATIDIFVVVTYGTRIMNVAKQVQENVQKSVESMTGLKVSAVNVYIQNMVLPKEDKNIDE